MKRISGVQYVMVLWLLINVILSPLAFTSANEDQQGSISSSVFSPGVFSRISSSPGNLPSQSPKASLSFFPLLFILPLFCLCFPLAMKGQAGMEFTIALSVVILVFVGIALIINTNAGQLQEKQMQVLMKSVGENIKQEVQLAKNAPGCFATTFDVPEKIDEQSYNFSLDGMELSLQSGKNDVVVLLDVPAMGRIRKGTNTLVKFNESYAMNPCQVYCGDTPPHACVQNAKPWFCEADTQPLNLFCDAINGSELDCRMVPMASRIIQRCDICGCPEGQACLPSGSCEGTISQCGNGACESGETSSSCPDDCTTPWCGNGECGADESYTSCPSDCSPICGNDICDAVETIASCPFDCENFINNPSFEIDNATNFGFGDHASGNRIADGWEINGSQRVNDPNAGVYAYRLLDSNSSLAAKVSLPPGFYDLTSFVKGDHGSGKGRVNVDFMQDGILVVNPFFNDSSVMLSFDPSLYPAYGKVQARGNKISASLLIPNGINEIILSWVPDENNITNYQIDDARLKRQDKVLVASDDTDTKEKFTGDLVILYGNLTLEDAPLPGATCQGFVDEAPIPVSFDDQLGLYVAFSTFDVSGTHQWRIVCDHVGQSLHLWASDEVSIRKTCDNNSICEAGETVDTCPADCSSYGEYLHFYSLTYYPTFGYDASHPPFPVGDVDFTIGVPYPGLPQFNYLGLQDIKASDDNKVNPTTTVYNRGLHDQAVNLSDQELLDLFNLYNEGGWMRPSVIQLADVQKVHHELAATNATYASIYGTDDLPIGVEVDSKLNPIAINVSSRGYQLVPQVGITLDDYQQGKTMVIPDSYGQINNQPLVKARRALWNYNSPAVREYLVRYVLAMSRKSSSHDIFIDNSYMPHQLTSYWSEHYLAPGSQSEQRQYYFSVANGIYQEILSRDPQVRMILNDASTGNSALNDYTSLLSTAGNFYGIMVEGGFYDDCLLPSAYSKRSCDVEWYWNLTQSLKDRGKIITYLVSGNPGVIPSDYSKLYQVWLWAHLLADDNTYFHVFTYLNQPGPDGQPFPYYLYNETFGMPLDPAPVSNGAIWSRRYERGVIEFDTSSGDLSAIRFIENVCGDSVCDSRESGISCPADCSSLLLSTEVSSVYYMMADGSPTPDPFVIVDTSLFNHIITLIGDPAITPAAGATLNGNDALSIDLLTSQEGKNPLSFSAWVKADSTSSGGHMVMSTDDGGYDWSVLQVGDHWHVYTGNSMMDTGFQVSPGVWHHIAALFIPGVGTTFYLDGVGSFIPEISYDASTAQMVIGAGGDGMSNFFDGSIDRVRVWDKVLTQDEIQAMVDEGHDAPAIIS